MLAVTDLLNAYTTDLTVTIPDDLQSEVMRSIDFPEFKNVQKIVFKGNQIHSDPSIPRFLLKAWLSPTSKITSVEFDINTLSGVDILRSLYILPAAVKNISFSSKEADGEDCSPDSLRHALSLLQPDFSNRGVRHFNGAMKLNLPAGQSHKEPFSLMVQHGDLFKFNLTRINYRLTSRDVVPSIASLVHECKNTLQFLDIAYKPTGA